VGSENAEITFILVLFLNFSQAKLGPRWLVLKNLFIESSEIFNSKYLKRVYLPPYINFEIKTPKLYQRNHLTFLE